MASSSTALAGGGRTGTVVIVGDCDGLFRSDGHDWVRLERGPAGRSAPSCGAATLGPVVSGDGSQSCSSRAVDGRHLGVRRFVAGRRVR